MATQILLNSYTVGTGGVGSVTFSNIPQTFTNLKVVWSVRTGGGSTAGNDFISFNGSTSSFSNVRLYGTGTSAGSDNNSNWVGFTSGANATGSVFANSELFIANYASSNNKSFSVDTVQEHNANTAYHGLSASLWANSTAINSITFTPDSGNYLEYSTFYLYGIDTNTAAPSGSVTIGTATASGSDKATVAFSGSVSTALGYLAVSAPGNIQTLGYSSPITVTGLTPSTSYTFKVAPVNTYGTGTYSSPSNSITTSAPGNYIAIATAVVDSGGASSVTFSSIPQGYKHLQIRAMCQQYYGGNDFGTTALRVNGDSGNNYTRHGMTANNFSGSASSYGYTNYPWADVGITSLVGSRTQYFGAKIIDILDYTDTSKYKTIRSLSGGEFNGSGAVALTSSVYTGSTNAITSLTLYGANGPFTNNTIFALYGVE